MYTYIAVRYMYWHSLYLYHIGTLLVKCYFAYGLNILFPDFVGLTCKCIQLVVTAGSSMYNPHSSSIVGCARTHALISPEASAKSQA